VRGCCRWGTTDKIRIVDKYCESEPTKVYVGIAIDEPKRIEKERKPYKIFPLVEWGMTEKDCLEYCRNNGWDWKEETPNGYIDLYDILDRVSCWCCSNKNRKELKNIYLYLPYYWNKLKEFQSKTERPMKKYSKKGILYGNVFDMEKIFEIETKREKGSVI